MPARNHKNWLAKPPVESSVASAIAVKKYLNKRLKTIFAKVWVPVIHKSEIRNEGDYRTSQIAFENIIVVNAGDRLRPIDSMMHDIKFLEHLKHLL